jgi:ATP-dependent helicase/nuclease subunit A
MRRSPASEAQVQAADPAKSVWLAANAGSGKTRVLTDRVARLLLGGTEPQRILCLTYTKAAASEMQNRLFGRLGRWAMLNETELRAELRELGIDGAVGSEVLSRARRLFARAIETPGGLKIQTIHSFCAGLLRRFPLEAGVSPDFAELDDRAAALMRQEIVEELAAGGDVAAVDALAGLHPADDLADVLSEISRNSAAFSALGGKELEPLCGVPDGYAEEDLLAEVYHGGESGLIAKLVPRLLASGPKDAKAGARLAAFSADRDGLALLESVLLYGSGARAPFAARTGDFPTKGLREGALAPMMPALEALMRRVEVARNKRLAIAAAEKSAALYRFARPFLSRYQARKAAGGYLDFDDLIARAAALLSDRQVAGWVLYRLDGGIDQILVDEAQDTSPGQWRVIEALAEEFTAGEGARGATRQIFVVGDKKQSIYSFQGANLATFDAVKADFANRHRAAGAPFDTLDLLYSFRSSKAVLDVVDHTFGAHGVRGLGGPTKHHAFRDALPGRVDLWPVVPKAAEILDEDWTKPVDLLPEAHHAVTLARRIAAEIRRLIDAGERIESRDGARALHEGDFLILLRRRSALFHEIIRACKQQRLAIAGADRLMLSGELAVKDLTALLSFLATPEDDLALACLLRSPLFGWSEDALYRLAQGRGEDQFLWQALRARGDAHGDTLAVLQDLLGRADFLRPYELIERMLTRHGGRRRLLARLGPEAEDGIDAFLAEALNYERAGVPSLTGFLVWMQTGEVEVKRRLDSASRAIRVMTVHGAKGLEAPVVILPDTAVRQKRDRGVLVRSEDGTALWKTRKEESPPVIAAALAARAEAEAEEEMRLLYVAMTRAESWLIVAAAGEAGAGAQSWYGLIAEAMGHVPSVGCTWSFGEGRRFEYGTWPVPGAEQGPPSGTGAAPVPDWVGRAPPPVPERAAPLSPSALGGAKALAGEAGRDEEAAKRRGTLLHSFLQHLPECPPDQRQTLAMAIAESAGLADLAETGSILAEALAVLSAPDLQPLFVRGALAEVEVSAALPELGGRIVQGVIDRLIVTPGRVLAVDFKSNAVVPARPEEVPDGILRQMGAYAAMLEAIYPGHTVETAVVWTRTARLMPLPLKIVREALAATTLP